MKKILYAIGALLVFGFIVSKCGDSEETKVSGSASSDTTKASTEQAPAKKENWSYSEDVDKMTSTKKQYAECTSTNRVEFEFPYNQDGGSSFVLLIRHDKAGSDVMLTVSKGQFITGVGDETIRMKFDNEEPIQVGISGSSSGSADVLFLSPVNKIINKLKKAKKVIIEPEFFQVGYKQVEFDTEGLVWKY